jgi:MATE family multidrug resistance protein
LNKVWDGWIGGKRGIFAKIFRQMFLDKSYYKANFTLALPIILASMGQSLVQMVDTMMVGRLGTLELAAVAFAGTISYNALVIGMGIAMALTPLTGQSFARKEYKNIAILLQNSLSLNTLISLIIVSILLILMPFLDYFGQPKEVIDICKPYYLIITISFLPQLIFLSFKQFMEGIGITKPSMAITISANILNIILNYLLIYGKFGFPQMGVTGAAIATFISRLLMPIAFFIYLYLKQNYRRYLSFFALSNLSKFYHIKLLRLGIPIAGQMFLEFFSLLGVTIMMGWVSAYALAAYQIVITIVGTTFLIASGVANSTTILISQEFGRNNMKELNKQFKTGFQLSLLTMSCMAIIMIFGGRYIAMIFSIDQEVIELSNQFFIVAGVFQIIDGSQVSVLGALRGINDVAKPMKYAFISYVFVALPFAYICGFVLNLGSWSIFAGFLVGLLTAAILYYRRFRKVVKRYTIKQK